MAAALVAAGAARAAQPADATQPASADPVTAAPAPATAAPDTSGEIVVTAQRRSENLRDVPISISAITPAQAEKFNIRTVQDLQLVTPGLSYVAPYTYAQIYIRGVGTVLANVGLETAVAVYVDGVYLERQLGTVFDLVDPATTQVLKGPQGTLYGRNATGGAILLNTANPTNQFEGRIAGEYGRYNRAQGDLMLNIPISDSLKLRVAARAQTDDGYIRNEFNGKTLGGKETYTGRAKISWTPGPDTNFLLTTEYIRNNADTFAIAQRSGAPICLACAIFPGQGAASGKYTTNQNVDGKALTKSFFTSLKSVVTKDRFDVTTLVSYRRFTIDMPTEVDGTPINFFTYQAETGGSTYTGDIQVTSKMNGPFNFLTGGSILQDNGFFNAGLSGLAFQGLPELKNSTKVRTRAAAVFLEGYYKITPSIKLTLGGRFSEEKKSLVSVNPDPAPLVFGTAGFTDKKTFKSFTPRAVLAYDADVGNFYVSFTKGFKSGGFVSPAFTAAPAVDPEKITSYEVGAKLRFAGNRVSLNLAAFHYDYKDLQVTITDFSRGGSFQDNAASATVDGVELDGLVRVIPKLTISFGAQYLKAKYKDYRDAQVYVLAASGFGLEPTPADLSGSPLPRAPKFTANLGLTYDMTLANGWTASVSAIGNYSSRFVMTAGAGGPLQFNAQGKYAVVNLTGFVSPPGNRMKVGFYVDNLTNADYLVNADTTQYGLTSTYARPRSYGGRFSYAF